MRSSLLQPSASIRVSNYGEILRRRQFYLLFHISFRKEVDQVHLMLPNRNNNNSSSQKVSELEHEYVSMYVWDKWRVLRKYGYLVLGFALRQNMYFICTDGKKSDNFYRQNLHCNYVKSCGQWKRGLLNGEKVFCLFWEVLMSIWNAAFPRNIGSVWIFMTQSLRAG